MIQSDSTPDGRQVHYGIREHGMGGVMNGMAAHGGVLPVGGTFLVFSDYMRGAVRLAALSQTKVVYSWTHDSVGVGEDGPTHQPIEHLAALRAMPGLRVIRPADANETAEAWRVAIDSDGPTALILSRQNLPVLDGTAGGERVVRGGYVLHEPDGGDAQVALVATGSEVWVCAGRGRGAGRRGHPRPRRVAAVLEPLRGAARRATATRCSRPASPACRSRRPPPSAGRRWADDSLGIDHFGASAPGEVVLERFGFTPENVAARARALID